MLFKKLSIIFILIFSLFTGHVPAQEIKIVQMSDIHLDTRNPDREVRQFAQSLPMFKKTIGKINALNPDIIVISGDMVNRPIPDEFDTFLNTAKSFNQEFYPALGNHDVGVGGGLSKRMIIQKINQNCNWLTLNLPYYYIIKGEYIFIFMDGTSDKNITSAGYFRDDVLRFLDETLSRFSSKKAIIVQHFPLIPPFKSQSHEIINRDDYFKIIENHNNVIMVLSGHFHASNAVERKNVLYITTPSMIEYPHAFRYLTVNSDKENITITSKLILDEEQNAKEAKQGMYGKLKLGQESDNNFTIQLKNNVPQEKEQPCNIFNKLIPVTGN